MMAPSGSLLFALSVLLLSGWTVSAISLNVSPDRQQFFTGESVRLSCEDEEGSAGWTLKKMSTIRTETCSAGEGFGRLNVSTCIVANLSLSSGEGVYWCEHQSGQRSIKVTITVSDQPFIMEIPALPVMAGSDVTLRCRDRRGSNIPVNFFKFGRHSAPIKAAPQGEFTIRNVQQSDEGYYWCSTDQITSASGRLSVTAAPPPPTNSSAHFSISSLIKLLCHLVVISPYCITTGLAVSICCGRRTAKTSLVTMEMAELVESDRGLDGEYVNDIADVTTEYDF